jgi:NTE family protein
MDEQNPTAGSDFEYLREALTPLFGDLSAESIREVERAGTWLDILGGERLIHLGEPADSLYLLVRGRLRASVPGWSSEPRVIGEVAVGESVGEMGLLDGGARNADIDAIRDSRLLRLSVTAFRDLVSRHPEFLWNLSRMVIRRMDRSSGALHNQPPVRTIAITGSAPDEARERFTRRLAEALEPHGSTAVLDSQTIRAADGVGGDARSLAIRLHEQESRHRFVLVPTGSADPERMDVTFRQADRILFVCATSDDPRRETIRGSARTLDDREVRVGKDLVMLHPDGSHIPSGTARWLDELPVGRVHHVREDREGDHQRLARFLAGRAVALILAGGGAKGFAHLGTLRALREESVPIDMVGGTSIGAVLAATIAFEWSEERLIRALRSAFVSTNPANDYQILPLVSISKGRKMERLLRRFLGETAIEDLWIPFFCVSSNLSASEKAIHTRGAVWKRLRASASIAGIFPPVVLDGQLHVDGGTFDNMPVGTARELGAGHVIACDVQRFTGGKVSYEAVPPTRALLADKFLFRRRRRVPGLISTMMQTTFLAGLDRARLAAAEADLFVEPNARSVRFLDWSALDRAAKIGYAHVKERFGEPETQQLLEAIRNPHRGERP